MKIKDSFVLRNILDEYLVIPTGDEMNEKKGVVQLNETGAFLWRLLQTEKTRNELIYALLEEYDIDKASAEKDIDEFLLLLSTSGCLSSTK